MALYPEPEPQESTTAHALLEVAIRIAQHGDKVEARQLLRSYLESHPQDERAWAWYVDTFSDDQKRLRILKVYLKHHPESRFAHQAIAALSRRLRRGENSEQTEEKTTPFRETPKGWPPLLDPENLTAKTQHTSAIASKNSEGGASPSRRIDETRILILAVSIILITVLLAVAWSLLH